MRFIKLMLLTVAVLLAASGQTHASLIFDYSFTNTIGTVSGTVTGQILGLSNNSTGPASEVLIDTFPAALASIAGPTPINATLWAHQFQNSFTVSGGQVVAGGFWAENGTVPVNFLQLYINGGSGPYNFLNLDGNDTRYVWGNNGFAAANIVPAPPVAPAITSAASTTFTVGSGGSFTVTDTGYPNPTLSESGGLPSGVTFNPSNGLLYGTPGAGTGGIYDLTFFASNGVGSPATQNFVLIDDQASAITSAASDTFAGGLFNSFSVTDTGFPNPTLYEFGALPAGVTFNPLTGLLSGTPAAVGGNYFLTFAAYNGVGAEAFQSFDLTVTPEPSSLALLCTGIGMGAMVVVRRRRKEVIN